MENTEKEICLGGKTYWTIKGITDFEIFFDHLNILIHDFNSVIYLEGVSMDKSVLEFCKQHKQKPWHMIKKGTIWPKSDKFHIPASKNTISGLVKLSKSLASPEVADHCHIYTRESMILQWYDACDESCPIGLADIIDEYRVKSYCQATASLYEKYNFG